MSSIIGWNTTNRVRADTAAIEKMINMVWRANKESDSSVDSQFDMRNTWKIQIKLETKKSFSNWSILFTYTYTVTVNMPKIQRLTGFLV